MSKPSRKERQQKQEKKAVSSLQRSNTAKANKRGEDMLNSTSFSLKYGIILLLLILGLFFYLK